MIEHIPRDSVYLMLSDHLKIFEEIVLIIE